MSAPRLTLCLITRDEEPVLEACLASFAPWVDEIVVVDTGSVDETRNIARRAGARVIEHPWNDDFSEARNVSLEAARGSWILVADADERLHPDDGKLLREAIANDQAAGFMVSCENLRDDGPPVACSLLRLFRRADEVRFRNAIHEQILGSLRAFADARGLAILSVPVRLRHTGYLQCELDRKQKTRRNLRIFRKQLERHPHDAYSWYKYGDAVRHVDLDEGRRALERAIELMEALPAKEAFALVFAAETYTVLAFDRLRAGLIDAAWELVETACSRHDVTPNLIFARGSIALHRSDWDVATEAFRKLPRYEGIVLPVPIEHGITGPIAQYGLGRAALGRRELDDAEGHFRQALATWPHYQDAAIALAELLATTGRTEDALVVLGTYHAYAREDAIAPMLAAKLCAMRGLWDQARDWLQRGRTTSAPDELTFDLGICQLLAGDDLIDVERTWSELHDGYAETETARWLLGALRGVPAPLPTTRHTDELISNVLQRFLAAGQGHWVEKVVDDLATRDPNQLSTPMLHALRSVVGVL